MDNTEFDSKLAAHNVATILTQASIGEIQREQIPTNVNSTNIATSFRDYSKQYAYYYKSFYNEALRHFENELSDC